MDSHPWSVDGARCGVAGDRRALGARGGAALWRLTASSAAGAPPYPLFSASSRPLPAAMCDSQGSRLQAPQGRCENACQPQVVITQTCTPTCLITPVDNLPARSAAANPMPPASACCGVDNSGCRQSPPGAAGVSRIWGKATSADLA